MQEMVVVACKPHVAWTCASWLFRSRDLNMAECRFSVARGSWRRDSALVDLGPPRPLSILRCDRHVLQRNVKKLYLTNCMSRSQPYPAFPDNLDLLLTPQQQASGIQAGKLGFVWLVRVRSDLACTSAMELLSEFITIMDTKRILWVNIGSLW